MGSGSRTITTTRTQVISGPNATGNQTGLRRSSRGSRVWKKTILGEKFEYSEKLREKKNYILFVSGMGHEKKQIEEIEEMPKPEPPKEKVIEVKEIIDNYGYHETKNVKKKNPKRLSITHHERLSTPFERTTLKKFSSYTTDPKVRQYTSTSTSVPKTRFDTESIKKSTTTTTNLTQYNSMTAKQQKNRTVVPPKLYETYKPVKTQYTKTTRTISTEKTEKAPAKVVTQPRSKQTSQTQITKTKTEITRVNDRRTNQNQTQVKTKTQTTQNVSKYQQPKVDINKYKKPVPPADLGRNTTKTETTRDGEYVVKVTTTRTKIERPEERSRGGSVPRALLKPRNMNDIGRPRPQPDFEPPRRQYGFGPHGPMPRRPEYERPRPEEKESEESQDIEIIEEKERARSSERQPRFMAPHGPFGPHGFLGPHGPYGMPHGPYGMPHGRPSGPRPEYKPHGPYGMPHGPMPHGPRHEYMPHGPMPHGPHGFMGPHGPHGFMGPHGPHGFMGPLFGPLHHNVPHMETEYMRHHGPRGQPDEGRRSTSVPKPKSTFESRTFEVKKEISVRPEERTIQTRTLAGPHHMPHGPMLHGPHGFMGPHHMPHGPFGPHGFMGPHGPIEERRSGSYREERLMTEGDAQKERKDNITGMSQYRFQQTTNKSDNGDNYEYFESKHVVKTGRLNQPITIHHRRGEIGGYETSQMSQMKQDNRSSSYKTQSQRQSQNQTQIKTQTYTRNLNAGPGSGAGAKTGTITTKYTQKTTIQNYRKDQAKASGAGNEYKKYTQKVVTSTGGSGAYTRNKYEMKQTTTETRKEGFGKLKEQEKEMAQNQSFDESEFEIVFCPVHGRQLVRKKKFRQNN